MPFLRRKMWWFGRKSVFFIFVGESFFSVVLFSLHWLLFDDYASSFENREVLKLSVFPALCRIFLHHKRRNTFFGFFRQSRNSLVTKTSNDQNCSSKVHCTCQSTLAWNEVAKEKWQMCKMQILPETCNSSIPLVHMIRSATFLIFHPFTFTCAQTQWQDNTRILYFFCDKHGNEQLLSSCLTPHVTQD